PAAGSTQKPSATPSRYATAAATGPTATDPQPGAKHTTYNPGTRAERPISTTAPCSAASIITSCTKSNGPPHAHPTASSTSSHPNASTPRKNHAATADTNRKLRNQPYRSGPANAWLHVW